MVCKLVSEEMKRTHTDSHRGMQSPLWPSPRILAASASLKVWYVPGREDREDGTEHNIARWENFLTISLQGTNMYQSQLCSPGRTVEKSKTHIFTSCRRSCTCLPRSSRPHFRISCLVRFGLWFSVSSRFSGMPPYTLGRNLALSRLSSSLAVGDGRGGERRLP